MTRAIFERSFIRISPLFQAIRKNRLRTRCNSYVNCSGGSREGVRAPLIFRPNWNLFGDRPPRSYLRFWMTGPHLSHSLDPALNCSRTRQTRRSINDLSVGPLPLSLIDPQMSECRRQINVVSVTLSLLVSNPANQICWNGVSSDEIRYLTSRFSCSFCACQKVMYSQQVTHGLLHLQYPGSRKWRQSTFFKFWPRLFKRWIALSNRINHYPADKC